MKNSKRIIAREWIIFLSSLFIGVSLTLAGFYLREPRYSYSNKPSHIITNFEIPPPPAKIRLNPVDDFFICFFNRNYWLQTWLTVLSVYFVVQLVRSVLWSIKTLKTR